MIIDTRNIPEGHSTLEKATMLESMKDQVPPFKDAISCRIEIDRTGSTIYIHLWFEGTFTLECSRCLQPLSQPISSEIRLILQESHGKNGPAQDDDAVDFFYDPQDTEVDLSPAIFEEIMTALPLKPLCSPDCKGIEIKDPDISIDYGKSNSKEIDPRWEALKKLKKE